MTSMCLALRRRARGRREGIGEAACFRNRDERVVGTVNDRNRATDIGADWSGPGRSMGMPASLPARRDDQRASNFGNGSSCLRRTAAVDAAISTIGRFEHQGHRGRINSSGSQGDGRAHRAAPEHRLKGQGGVNPRLPAQELI